VLGALPCPFAFAVKPPVSEAALHFPVLSLILLVVLVNHHLSPGTKKPPAQVRAVFVGSFYQLQHIVPAGPLVSTSGV
jgi:hypothetical protein